ncbi:MAG: BBE domain-containing protein, partial [Propionibacteriaceae bacterium]
QLQFALYPVPQVYAGDLYYPLDRAQDVLSFFSSFSRSVPPELTSAVTFRRFPPLPTLPETLRGRSLVAFRGCFCGDPTEGRALIDQVRAALGPAVVDTFETMPTSALASVSMDPEQPLGALSHAEMLADLTPVAIDALVELAGPDADSPLVMLEVRQLGGALQGPPDALSPMAHTGARFSLNAIGITPNPDQEGAVRSHLQRLEHAVRPHATGDSYVNFLDLDGATDARIRAAYSEGDRQRLLRLKATYDPDNLFRFNRNLSPGTTDSALTQEGHQK